MSVAAGPGTGLLRVAEKIAVLAADRAAAADTSRQLSPEVVEALSEAGFARHFVAADLGGTEGTFGELTAAIMAIAEGCAATAWCASLSAFSSRFASHLPEEGHHELWAAGPDTFVVTGQPPLGRAVTAPGGFRLSGRWTYVSGVDVAEWALLCATASGAGEPELRFFALPRRGFQIVETWDSIGMRATSTHTVVVEDAFVPSHLTFPKSDLVTGTNAWSQVSSHNVPFQAVGGLTFIAPAVGAGYGALRACSAALDGKRHSAVAAAQLVRASGRIDAARFLVEQNAAVLDERAFTPALMARNERNAAFSAEMLALAVGELLHAAGTSGMSESRPLQRFWRDVIGATSHVALRYETAATANYSAALIGA